MSEIETLIAPELPASPADGSARSPSLPDASAAPALSPRVHAASVHGRSIVVRSAAAIAHEAVTGFRQPAGLVRFVKSLIKFPVEYRAARAHQAIPVASFLEVFPETASLTLTAPPSSLGRHGWNVKLHEEMLLGAAVAAIQARQIFEIGTFDGGTTRRLAESAPDDATVYTMDLPEDAFDASQSPTAFNGSRVGEKYRASAAASKVRQIRHDAATFDFGPYRGRMDFVFVDAAHDHPHGLCDSKNALTLVRPGGVVVWHDFEPYWSGLVHAVCEATTGLPLRRLGGTSMAAVRMPPVGLP